MTSRPNILWIIVDSVRNYHTDADDRGRIDIIDKLATRGVEFTTAVTSAPSTVMSTSAMMTGVPSIYQSLIYEGFNSETRQLKTLQKILSAQGYDVRNTIFFPEGRRYLGPMIGDLSKRHWPSHLNEDQFWSNDQINEILDNILNDPIDHPFFLYLNYNCRHDPLTSEKVECGLDKLKRLGMLDNTIIVINSDHGYPDPSRDISYTEMRNLGHDLVMTDDNILVPLVFVVPSGRARTISEAVSLLDVVPTLLDLVGIGVKSLSNKNVTGRSLKQLIVGEVDKPNNTVIRIDNRYIAQPKRLSALRNNRYKYICEIDTGKEFFYDTLTDKLELKNLIDEPTCQELIEQFREQFLGEEQDIFNHHVEYVTSRLSKFMESEMVQITLVEPANKTLLSIFEAAAIKMKITSKIIKNGGKILSSTLRTDSCFVILEGSNPREHSKKMLIARKYSDNVVVLNENFSRISEPEWWVKVAVKRFLIEVLPLLFKNPKAFWADVSFALKHLR